MIVWFFLSITTKNCLTLFCLVHVSYGAHTFRVTRSYHDQNPNVKFKEIMSAFTNFVHIRGAFWKAMIIYLYYFIIFMIIEKR